MSHLHQAVPSKMSAYVLRPERTGEPQDAYVREQLDVPEIGPDQVLVRIMAVSVNYNGVWAAMSEPVPVYGFHGDDFHIGGSEASGVVAAVGPQVRRFQVGDEVMVHPGRYCGRCDECNGFDPLACDRARVWGYETNWGAFAEYSPVQEQQLVHKPGNLNWEEAASCAGFGIAHRMLVKRAGLAPEHNVLIWGAAGGSGAYSIQLCRLVGANVIAVVSSPEKAALCEELGANWVIDRRDLNLGPAEARTPREERRRLVGMNRFRRRLRELTGGRDPDIVCDHNGSATFPTSLYVCRKFGCVVMIGATTGYRLEVDARYLWLNHKSIIGSHLCNAHEAEISARLMAEGKIRPVVTETFAFDELPLAHQRMRENLHMGKLVVRVGA